MRFQNTKKVAIEPYIMGPVQNNEILRKSFRLFDTDNTGYANPKELISCLLQIVSDENHHIIHQIIALLDRFVRDSKMLTFSDFANVLQGPFKGSSDEPYEAFNHLFHLLAPPDTGKISLESLRNTCKELDEQVTEEDIRQMISYADLDKDGCVNFEEFSNMLLKMNLKK